MWSLNCKRGREIFEVDILVRVRFNKDKSFLLPKDFPICHVLPYITKRVLLERSDYLNVSINQSNLFTRKMLQELDKQNDIVYTVQEAYRAGPLPPPFQSKKHCNKFLHQHDLV